MLFNFLVSLATMLIQNKGPLVNGPLDIPLSSPVHKEHEFIPYPDGPQTLEEEVKAARALHGHHYGGDMILPDAYNESGAGLRDERFRWPGYPGRAVIPFVIDDSLANLRQMIFEAMIYFVQATTCVRFKERSDEKDFVKIYKNGCWSRIGRNGGMQELSLGDGCNFPGVILHQLGHVVGLVHEHQRPDRDTWIYIIYNHVMPGKEEKFNLTNINDVMLWTQYDYDSIMHYGYFAFSQKPNILMTIGTRTAHLLLEPFQKKEKNSVNQIFTTSKDFTSAETVAWVVLCC